LKRLTDVDGGFFSRRGLSHTRFAVQEESPSEAFSYLAFFAFFAAVASSPTWARLFCAAMALLTLCVFVCWSFQSVRAILKAYRRDVKELNEKIIRDVIES
jgi:threonine/homoserine/homoserine lactone efflux protein